AGGRTEPGHAAKRHRSGIPPWAAALQPDPPCAISWRWPLPRSCRGMGVLERQASYPPRSRMRALALAVSLTLPIGVALVTPSRARASAAPAEREAAPAAAESAEASETEEVEKKPRRFWEVDRDDPAGVTQRRFMIGIEGVVMQTPPLRTEVVFLDPRFVGRGVAMGGLGLFGRFRARPLVGFDVNVR